MPRLEFPGSKRPTIEIGGNVSIGRSADHADVVVQDKRLSRKHCEFFKESEQWFVRDLGSANGTRLKGADVLEKSPLNDGDELSFGGVIARFYSSQPELRLEDSDEFILDDPSFPGKSDEPEAEEPVVPVLKLLSGTLRARLVQIDNNNFTIGRRAGNDLVLTEDPQASGSHASISRDGDEWTFRDLGSTNGSRIDGEPTSECLLKEGMRVQIGSQLFVWSAKSESDSETISVPPSEISLSGEDEFEVLEGLDELDTLDSSELDDPADENEDAQRLEYAVVETKGSPKTKMLFRILEGAVLLVVIGAVIALLMFVLDNPPADEEEANKLGVDVPSGGLLSQGGLKGISSFEDIEGHKSSELWRQVSRAGSDGAAFVREDAKDGDFRMVLSRRSLAPDRQSRWVLDRFLKLDEGHIDNASGISNLYDYSIQHRKESDDGNGGGAMLFVYVEWYAEARESSLLYTETRGFEEPKNEWAEMSGQFQRPHDGKYARFGVGIAGKAGVVSVDAAKFTHADGGNAREPNKHEDPQDLALDIRPDAMLSLYGVELGVRTDGTRGSSRQRREYWQGITLSARGKVESERQRVGEWISKRPAIEVTKDSASATFIFVDPRSSATRQVTLKWDDHTLKFSQEVPSSAKYREIGLVGAVTKDFLREEVVTLGRGGGVMKFSRKGRNLAPQEAIFASMHGARRIRFGGDVILENGDLALGMFTTGTNFSASFSIEDYDGLDGREYFESLRKRSKSPNNSIRNGRTAYDLAMFAALNAADAAKDTKSAAKILGLLELTKNYPFDFQAIGLAREAIRDMEDFYQERLHETKSLVSGAVNSSENPDHFVASILRAKAFAHDISRNEGNWKEHENRFKGDLKSSRVPQRFRGVYEAIANSLAEIRTSATAFQESVLEGNVAAFEIASRAQARQAQPVLATAEELLADGESNQALLKLLSIPKSYPYTREATKARQHLLVRAQALHDESESLAAEGLDVIAREKRDQARELAASIEASSLAMMRHEGLGIEDAFAALGDRDWILLGSEEWREIEKAIQTQAALLAEEEK